MRPYRALGRVGLNLGDGPLSAPDERIHPLTCVALTVHLAGKDLKRERGTRVPHLGHHVATTTDGTRSASR